MISVTDLRSGMTFEENGTLLQVLSYEHIKMGRGSANIKIRVKNLSNGATVEKSYINGAKVKPVQVLKRDMQYLYKDSDFAYFMHPDTYEQTQLSLLSIQGHIYLKDGESFSVSFLNGQPLSVSLPPKLVFTITETGPSIKGNSATNVFKDAILENGQRVKVPLFLNTNDKVRIDTRTGAYCEKA